MLLRFDDIIMTPHHEGVTLFRLAVARSCPDKARAGLHESVRAARQPAYFYECESLKSEIGLADSFTRTGVDFMQQDGLTRRTVLAGLGAALATRSAYAAPPAQSEWSRLELLDAGDRPMQLGADAGKMTLLHLWASWCPVCLNELPTLNTASLALGQRGIEMLLVSSPLDWSADLHAASSRSTGLRFVRPSFRNSPAAIRSALFSRDGWYYVPRSLLYDHDARRIVWTDLGRLDWEGAPWSGHLPGVGA